jgi:mannosyltransferase
MVTTPQVSLADRPETKVSDRRATIALAAAVLLGSVLRLANLNGKSIWLDEAFSITLARASWTAFWHTVKTTEANMSVYYLLLRFWLHLGRDPATVRLLSAIAGILTIPIVYAIGSRLFDRRAGIVAAFLFAIDPLHLAASQEARGYSLAILLIACSTWAFVHIVSDNSATGGMAAPAGVAGGRHHTGRQVFWCSLYTCASALALYAHFYTGFVLLAQWLSLAARPPGRWWRPLLASGAGSGLLLIPLALFLLQGSHRNIDWLGGALRAELPEVINTVRTAPGLTAVILYGSTILAVIWASVLAVRIASPRSDRWAQLLALLWLITPIAIPLAISVAIKPVLNPRYLVVCTPGFSLAAASVLTRASRPRLARFAVAAIVMLAAFADWTYFASFRQENWRDATRELLTESRPGDVALFYARYVRRPFDFYAELAARGSNAPQPQILYPDAAYSDFSSTVPGLTLEGAVDRARVTAPRAWIVISHTGSTDGACMQALDEALRPAFPKVEERDYQWIKVRLYSRAQDSIPAIGANAVALPPVGAALSRACTQA